MIQNNQAEYPLSPCGNQASGVSVLLQRYQDGIYVQSFAVDSYAIHFFCIGGNNY